MGTSIPVRANGEVIDQSWFNTPRSEISTLDDRVDALGSNNSIPFNVYGYYNNSGSLDNVIVHKVTQSMQVSSAVLHIATAGSAGSTKVMLKKRSGGSWLNMFSTAPIVPASAGDHANSATGSGATAAVVIASLQSLVPGDLLSIDQQQTQGGNPDTYILNVYVALDGV